MLKVFGVNLKELRTEAGLKQKDLAAVLSVSKTTICQWETSKQEPSLEDVVKIAAYFKVSCDYLLGVEYPTDNSKPTNNSFKDFQDCSEN
ncbi:MAG: helix-turn-helix transcriptional regulator [Clostridia bacterium]|nr:helix-turn-helix transcriptional regulator [Clostridia bacterium]